MLRLIRGAVAAALACFALVAGGLSMAQSDSERSMTIFPSGQRPVLSLIETIPYLTSGVLPPHADDQREMYGELSQTPPGLTNAGLSALFKPAPLGFPAAPESIIAPRPGVLIARDAFGVPHITAAQREDLLFGIGFATASDRLWFMDIGRRAVRGRLSEFLGPLDFALELDSQSYSFAAYSEAELQAQFDLLPVRYPLLGNIVQADVTALLEGINAYVGLVLAVPLLLPPEYLLVGPPEFWTESDIVIVAVAIELLFGAGGGEEHVNAELLQTLTAAFGDATGAAVFRDLRRGEDPEAPVSTSSSFPYPVTGAVDPASVALPDPGSFIAQSPVVYDPGPGVAAEDTATAEAALFPGLETLAALGRGRRSMSNFLVVNAAHAAGGRPIAVMGQQSAYFVPQVLTEISYRGGGLDSRGLLPPGFPYTIFGRGPNHAWSPTSGGSDNTDVRAELLCELNGSDPTIDSKAYVFNNTCVPMAERIDRWCAGSCAPGVTNVTAVVQRTIHGLVFGRATVDSQFVALVRQRASYAREFDSTIAYLLVNGPVVDAAGFAQAMSVNPASFNWAFLDATDVQYFHSGRYPLRAAGVDPDLPSWGTGEWEWQGLVPPTQQPQELNPARGFLTSWNNKPAPDWRAADNDYGYGSVYRVDLLDQLLEEQIDSGVPITAGRLVEIMGDAGHRDLRGVQMLPWALELVQDAVGPGSALEPALTALETWRAAGAPRRDRNADGEYEHSGAVALMDAWFEPMIHAAFDGQLAGLYDSVPMGFDNEPGPVGSAYQSGYYGYLQKALRMALGEPVAGPFEALRCADGTGPGCGVALSVSLAGAVAELTVEFGSPDPADWRVEPTDEQVQFLPLGLLAVEPVPWINRPTFQQLIQFAAP